ncbi:MAG: SDR family oxidoreductase [Bacteroidetes bacterium]|nr:SDR family oxidoreductase [Bacteroidota bacterium]
MNDPQKRYLFAGASSKIAIETANLLRKKKNIVMGISTKNNIEGYDSVYEVNNYNFGSFPEITDGIDGIVYFPGTINLKPFHLFTEKDFLNDYNINVLGAIAFTQAYLKNLKSVNSPSIVFISSVAATQGMPYHSSISAAKSAIEGLTRSLAAELAPKIRVNCVAPSLTETTLSEKFINTPEKLEASQKRNPLKKIGSATDIANAIEFLLSEKSNWITSQTLSIDGGMNNIKL